MSLCLREGKQGISGQREGGTKGKEREGEKGVRKTQKGWSARQMTNCD